MPTVTTTTTTVVHEGGRVETTTTTTTDVRHDGAARAERGAAAGAPQSTPQWQKFEDPATLPFKLPKGLDDVDAAWMTALLQHRGILSPDVTVTSIEKKGVGMTAGYLSAIAKVRCKFSKAVPGAPVNYVVKVWPPFEIAPKEMIAAMFASDIKGYCEFPPDDFFPRVDCYLASYDAENFLYGLVLGDADDSGEHKIHEVGLTLEDTLKMIPKLAQVAAKFENCHQESSPMFKMTQHLPMYSSPEYLSMFSNPAAGGKPFSSGGPLTDKLMSFPYFGDWNKNGMGGYSSLFAKKFQAYMSKVHPDNGGSVTMSHGDPKGDNIFFSEKSPSGWQVIDFQLSIKGPVPTDLAYIMSTGTVKPDVYEKHEEQVLRSFYDEFQKHTVHYKSDVYPFEKFVEEYVVMAHLILGYCCALGAAIWESGAVDGKLDPSQPDTVVGPLGAAPELGSGAVKEADLSPEDKRKRLWWSMFLKNNLDIFKRHGTKALLESLADNPY